MKDRMDFTKIVFGLLISLGSPVLSQTFSYIGTQFITYNGTITGIFTPEDSSCLPQNISALEDSQSMIGVNPPWDSNQFWFSLYHSGQIINITNGELCVNVGGCTNDPIYNLGFQTAYDICLDNSTGSACTFSFAYHFVPYEIIDLHKSSITRLQAVGGGKEQGYRVIGNESSFVYNTGKPPVNSFDYQNPVNSTTGIGCPDELSFEWNASTPFTYAVSFSNFTAEVNLSITAPAGTVEMSFSGNRVDDLNNPNDDVNPYDGTNYTAIALNSSNTAFPQFMFANGSAIEWQSYSFGEWGAFANTTNSTDATNNDAASLSRNLPERAFILLWSITWGILIMSLL